MLGQDTTTIAKTTTGPDGNFLFENIAPGLYSVAFRKPDGFDFNVPQYNIDTNLGSTVVDFSIVSSPLLLMHPGGHICSVDAGLRPSV